PKPVPATWQAMTALEPRLINLERRARACRRYRNRWLAYEGLKRELTALVGWDCGQPSIASSGHYEAAIDRIAMALEV
ncbi:MAG: hypothetical protein KDA51_05940, partial [Planctomycetales bacterium]|nr:hypothetical protein [Planctomycetales bacterium]